MAENEIKNYLIMHGTVVNATSSRKASVAVADGRILAVGDLGPGDYRDFLIIDASGMFILPGGIDPHVHLSLPTPAGPSSDDFLSGSNAALAGGTTAFIDFVTPKRGQSLIEAYRLRDHEARQSACDYKLHMGISEWNQQVKEEVVQCIHQLGIKSFKAYLAYRESIGISYEDLKQLMKVVGQEGGLVLVHCEEGDVISHMQQKFISEGKTNAAYHALSRPPATEINAIRRVIGISRETSCPVYIVHVSTAEGAREIRKAKESGLKVFGETCIQYLVLNDEVYNLDKESSHVLPYIISPPIRSEENRQLLWDELVKGAFDTVATDHCPFNLFGQKDLGIKDFRKIPNGAGGIEYRLSILHNFGVKQGKINLEKFVSLTSANASNLFGWGAQKGQITEGYDADILVWDPSNSSIISRSHQVQSCDSNIYEGIRVEGRPAFIFSKGKLIEH